LNAKHFSVLVSLSALFIFSLTCPSPSGLTTSSSSPSCLHDSLLPFLPGFNNPQRPVAPTLRLMTCGPLFYRPRNEDFILDGGMLTFSPCAIFFASLSFPLMLSGPRSLPLNNKNAIRDFFHCQETCLPLTSSPSQLNISPNNLQLFPRMGLDILLRPSVS